MSSIFFFIAIVAGYVVMNQSTDSGGADVASYTGISLIVMGMIGALKRLFRTWIDRKEPMLALMLTMAIGIAAKVGGYFPGNDLKSWLNHIIALLIAAAGAGIGHDYLINGVFNTKGDSSPPAPPK